MDIAIPQTIKGYRLLERIGSGGFGAVYRARQTSINREVALKIILPDLANKPNFIRRFEIEAMLIARLEHPHIVPLHDYWRDQTGAYLVMRYLKGGSLRTVIDKEGALDLNVIAEILEHICSALDLAHRSNIVHRDIKPDNILLDEDGNAYLADFGIAKDLDISDGAVTEADAVVGSLDYISPEQARSEEITSRTDIYSLGVTTYELLAGKHPFHEFTGVQRLFKHINEPLPQLEDIEGLTSEQLIDLDDVMQKATAKNPANRYETVGEFYKAFSDAMGLQTGSTQNNIIEQLTLREQEILQLIADGLSNRDIAENLFISIGTVKWHIKQLYKKLGVRSRVQAIVRARELDLIVPEDVDAWLGEKLSSSSISLPEPENPYKGLQAFQTVDAVDYHGQEKLIDKLIQRMDSDELYKRFLAIVGPSGSGKSSLIRAGLIPALWNGRLQGSEKWFVVEMLPGTHPIEELEIALSRIAANQSHNLNEHLLRDERGLLRVANLILPQDNSELLIVIDQFEELFTLVEDEAQRQAFLKLIENAVIDPRSRIRIMVTLRADYYDKPLHYPDFAEMLRARMETILPLGAKALERVIRGPAERVKVIFEDGLVAQIVSEMTYQIGALPMLQYALTELFNRRKGRVLTHEAYQEIGGAVGALAHRADEIYFSFAENEQELIRQIFLRLVTLGEGAEDTRRRATFNELLSLTEQPDVMEEIIDAFADHRLLSLGRDDGTRQATVEVAHEAILQEWSRLRQWLNESRDDIRLERQLAQAADDWQDSHQDMSYLLRGSRLEQFANWQDNTELILTPLEATFIRCSLVQRDSEIQAEKERKAREATLEQRSVQRLRWLVAVFVVATIIAGGLAFFAFDREQEAQAARATSDANAMLAEQRANQIQSRVLIDEAEKLLDDVDIELATILALEAAELDSSPQRFLDLTRAIAEKPFIYARLPLENFDRFLMLNNDYLIAVTDENSAEDENAHRILMIDMDTTEIVQEFSGHEISPYYMETSPDNRFALSSSVDGSTILWDVETGAELFRLQGMIQPPLKLVWDTDNHTVIFRLFDYTATETEFDFYAHLVVDELRHDEMLSLNLQTGEVTSLLDLLALSEEVPFAAVQISSDLQHIIFVEADHFEPNTSFDGTARLLELDTMRELTRHENILGVNILTNDIYITLELAEASPPVFKLWSVSTQDNITNFDFAMSQGGGGAKSVGTNMIFASSGEFFAYDLLTNTELFRIKVPAYLTTYPNPGWLTPDNRILAAYHDGAIEFWNTNISDFGTGQLVEGHKDETKDVDLSPDGTQILTTGGSINNTADSNPSSVILWDLASRQEILRMDGHMHTVTSVEFSPDGKRAISGAMDNQVIYWDLATGEPIHILEAHTDYVWDVYFHPDGRRAISSGKDKSIILWDLEKGEIIRKYLGHEGRVWNAVFNSDGSMIASTSDDGTVILWDTETAEIIRQIDVDYTRTFHVEFTPDDKSIYVGTSGDGDPGRIFHINVATGEIIQFWDDHTYGIYDLEIDSTGRFMVTGGPDKQVILWDLEAGEVLSIFDSPMDGIWDTTFGPDGQSIIYAFDTIHIIDISKAILRRDELVERLRSSRDLRELSCEERELYLLDASCEAEQ